MSTLTLWKRPKFSAFRSAREEADAQVAEEDWDNEGGQMSSTSVRVEGTAHGRTVHPSPAGPEEIKHVRI